MRNEANRRKEMKRESIREKETKRERTRDPNEVVRARAAKIRTENTDRQ